MKIVACNWKEWERTGTYDGQEYFCRWVIPSMRPEGTVMKRLFIYGDWFSVAFGPKDTMDHLEYARVVYSILAILIALVSFVLPVRHMSLQLGLSLFALSFPTYGMLGLKFCEGFPAESFEILYEVLSVAFVLAYLTYLVASQARCQSAAKAFYVFLGAQLFVLILSGLDGHWPYVGMNIGDPPTYNMPYFVGLIVGIVCAIGTTIFPKRIVKDFIFHFATACYLVFALLAGLYPTIDFIKDTPADKYDNNDAMTYGIGCGLIVVFTAAKLILNRDAAIKEYHDHDSEIEMADPERGDHNQNPLMRESSDTLMRESSDTLTKNPLWSLTKEVNDDNDEEDLENGVES